MNSSFVCDGHELLSRLVQLSEQKLGFALRLDTWDLTITLNQLDWPGTTLDGLG